MLNYYLLLRLINSVGMNWKDYSTSVANIALSLILMALNVSYLFKDQRTNIAFQI